MERVPGSDERGMSFTPERLERASATVTRNIDGSRMSIQDSRLAGLLPDGTADYLATLLARQPVVIRLAPPRRTKLGDHRPPSRRQAAHRISVNDDLNPYAFLTTLLHEIAHATAWEKYRRRVRRLKPHGSEWKEEFEAIVRPVVAGGALPADIALALAAFMQRPAATTCTDRGIMLALARYDAPKPGFSLVEELPIGTVFRIGGGKVFSKGQPLRSRHCCTEWSTGRIYRVHGLSRVERLEEPPEKPASPGLAFNAFSSLRRFVRQRF
ncbi:MAG: hypothetical protein NTY87_00405 [Planctomycetia bacterium]|nr:hypothetical protein [Planctomycetia bacterium]